MPISGSAFTRKRILYRSQSLKIWGSSIKITSLWKAEERGLTNKYGYDFIKFKGNTSMDFSGKDTSYGNKWDKLSDGHECLTKQWFFDVQWSNCPIEIAEIVKQMWIDDDRLHNDVCIIKGTLEDLNERYDSEWGGESEKFVDCDLCAFLRLKGVKDGEIVIIHYWW